MDEFIKFFFSQGVLGVIALGEFLIIGYMYRERIKDLKENTENMKQVQNSLAQPVNKLQETVDTIITKTQQTNEILLNIFSKRKR